MTEFINKTLGIKIIRYTFAKSHKKNPDSSPVTESWERNARDCIAKVHIIWNITKIFLSSPPNAWSGINAFRRLFQRLSFNPKSFSFFASTPCHWQKTIENEGANHADRSRFCLIRALIYTRSSAGKESGEAWKLNCYFANLSLEPNTFTILCM